MKASEQINDGASTLGAGAAEALQVDDGREASARTGVSERALTYLLYLNLVQINNSLCRSARRRASALCVRVRLASPPLWFVYLRVDTIKAVNYR
ncbi:hypothetical protein EVAR_78369_1 [Eumeta japonica]|uniref:Uncharacterized protein n=1 Tax=Eumeta variegata TaxID=151549 RepID=A0A4C1T6X8_EUMVA|nr:hypothetical protein EVAR_78369_1 [Eumeta japonica]